MLCLVCGRHSHIWCDAYCEIIYFFDSNRTETDYMDLPEWTWPSFSCRNGHLDLDECPKTTGVMLRHGTHLISWSCVNEKDNCFFWKGFHMRNWNGGNLTVSQKSKPSFYNFVSNALKNIISRLTHNISLKATDLKGLDRWWEKPVHISVVTKRRRGEYWRAVLLLFHFYGSYSHCWYVGNLCYTKYLSLPGN